LLGFDEVCASLSSLGYRIAAGVFSAAEVGAPHRRERLFILAHREHARRPKAGQRCDLDAGREPETGRGSVADADELPAWPPGPTGDWSGVPEWLWPATTQSSVRRVAHGSAARVDRLRACGNGVVPLVAAHAFRTLAAALMKIDLRCGDALALLREMQPIQGGIA
jgi:DNA (cytosine-5)-methyltransferase 1